jgi:WXXGXW repeat (2 copies)
MSGQKEDSTMRTFVVIRSLLFAVMLMTFSAASFAQIGISVSFGPPALPVYEQPICPGDGYIWTPGYWAWDGSDYYWVPGTWVEAPEVGFLWTPGYWGWGGNAFFFHEGYWGPHVGYYGGINYGFGYGGHGYEGGRWENNHFYYNSSVNRINNENIHNTYNTRVEYNSGNRVSYNGGNGGINERPSAQEETYDKERHTGPVSAQNQHMQQARSNPELRASANQGKPPIGATSKPGDFKGSAVPAKEAGAPYKAPERTATGNEARLNEAHTNANSHASEVQPHKYTASSTGKPSTDQKYQQQQDKLAAKQNQEHQKLQQQQEKEHQQAAKKNSNEAQKQQMEQRHTQQTQQLEQKHASQQQKVQTHQQPHQSSPPPQSHPPAEKH